MQGKTLICVFGLLAVCSALSTAQAQSTMVISSLTDTDTMPYGSVLDPGSVNSYITLRASWANLEPTNPYAITGPVVAGNLPPPNFVYNWTTLDTEMSACVQAGKKVILRLIVNGDTAANTPPWLWYLCSIGPFQGIDNMGVGSKLWVYWDPLIQPVLQHLYQAIAQHYQQYETNGNLVCFCVAGLEGHTGAWGIPTNPANNHADINEWMSLGYTSDLAISTVQSNIDVCMAAFPPQVTISLSVGRDGGQTGTAVGLDPTQYVNGVATLPTAAQTQPYYVCDQLVLNNVPKYGARFNINNTNLIDYWPTPVDPTNTGPGSPAYTSDAYIFWQYAGLVSMSYQAVWYVYGDNAAATDPWRDNGGNDPGLYNDIQDYNYIMGLMMQVANAYTAAQPAGAATPWFEVYQIDCNRLSSIIQQNLP